MEVIKAEKHWAFFVPCFFYCIFVLLIMFPFFFGIGGSILIILPPFLIIAYYVLLYKFEKIEVKENRLCSRTGLINIRQENIPLDKISYLSEEKNILGLIFGFGTITVQSSAVSSTIKYPYIKKPNEFIQKVNDLKQ